MGHPRRRYEHSRTYFVTNRVAQGLPLVPNAFINAILMGILARGQALTPSITICEFLFMANHYHAILVCSGDPNDLAKFMNYVDGEIAKAIKQLLGISYNTKIWAQRYHSAAVLDPEAVMQRLAYIYTNPVSANLVSKAEEWFGVGFFDPSFEEKKIKCKYFPSSLILSVPNKGLSEGYIATRLRDMSDLKVPEHELHIEPLAWMSSFSAFHNLTKEVVCMRILLLVEEAERREAREREKTGRSLPTKRNLQHQNLHKSYLPKKFGKRVYCISTSIELRQEYIELYKEFCETCKRVWKKWCEGIFDETFPPGAFIPSRGVVANILPAPI